jgi:acetyltransferase-like isoleucine patch superfamily enzyme
MLGLLKKAFWIARSRPTQLWAVARQYALFARTRVFQRLVFTAENGIELGSNVRIQRLACLSADRPGGRISIGADSIVYENARIQACGKGRVSIGASSIIGDARIYSRAEISMGDRIVTSWNVFIQDFDPHPIEPELRAVQMLRMTGAFKPAYRPARALPELEWDFPSDAISIGDDVWLGANVTVLKGARIGSGCVVATGSVVTAGDYPARSILAGAPSRVIKALPAPSGPAARAAALVAGASEVAPAQAETPRGLTTAAALAALSPQSAEAIKTLASAAGEPQS